MPETAASRAYRGSAVHMALAGREPGRNADEPQRERPAGEGKGTQNRPIWLIAQRPTHRPAIHPESAIRPPTLSNTNRAA